MEKNESKRVIFIKNFVLIAVICLQLAICFYYGVQKVGFDIDEIFSYGLANGYYRPFFSDAVDYTNEWHTSEYFYQDLVTTEETRFQYDSVYYNQTQDVHPPIYYYLLHTVCSLFTGVFSKWFGLGLNAVFFAGAAFLLYRVSCFYLDRWWPRILTVALWGFSAGAFSTFLLIRMYMQLTFAALLYVYVHLAFVHGKKITWRGALGIIATVAFGVLTHYYFLIFAFWWTAAECLLRLVKKQYAQMLFYGATTALGVVVSILYYPALLEHLLVSGRGQDAVSNLQQIQTYIDRCQTFLYITFEEQRVGLFCALVLTVLLLVWLAVRAIRLRLKHAVQTEPTQTEVFLDKLFLLTFTLILSFGLITMVAAYTVNRYVYFLYPFAPLVAVIVFYYVCKVLPIHTYLQYILLACVCAYVLRISWQYRAPEYSSWSEALAVASASEHQGSVAVFINEQPYRSLKCIPEFDYFEQILIIKPDAIDQLDAFAEEVTTDSVIVYLPSSANPDVYLEVLFEAFSLQQATELWSHSFTVVYELTP